MAAEGATALGFGPPPDHEIFGTKWCRRFRDLTYQAYGQGQEDILETSDTLEDFSAAFRKEALLYGFINDPAELERDLVVITPRMSASEAYCKFPRVDPFMACMTAELVVEEMAGGRNMRTFIRPKGISIEKWAHKWCVKFGMLYVNGQTPQYDFDDADVETFERYQKTFIFNARYLGITADDFGWDPENPMASLLESDRVDPAEDFPGTVAYRFPLGNPYLAAHWTETIYKRRKKYLADQAEEAERAGVGPSRPLMGMKGGRRSVLKKLRRKLEEDLAQLPQLDVD